MALVGTLSGSTRAGTHSAANTAISGTVAIADRAGTPADPWPAFPGSDVTLFVSGTLDFRNAADPGVSVFGGDTIVSGTLIVSGAQRQGKTYSGGSISGSIHNTSLGLSYLQAGSNVTITSASNGQVTIAATDSSGISWDGSTPNGVATFKDSDEATVESNLTFDGSILTVVGDSILGGAVTVNDTAADKDFRVESTDIPGIILTDAATNQLLLHTSGTTAAGTPGAVAGTDVAIYLSGAVGSAGTPNTWGAALFTGDVVISGSLLGRGNSELPLKIGSSTEITGTLAINSGGEEALRISKADGDLREIVFEKEGVDAASIYLNSAEHLFIRQEDATLDIAFRIAAVNAMRIDGSASKIGMWTDSPAGILDVHGVAPAPGNHAVSQVFFLSGSGGKGSPMESTYGDLAFFVSGSTNSKGTPKKGVALFGGDLVVSGGISNTHDSTGLKINSGYGDILRNGNSVTTAGSLYYLSNTGAWTQSNAGTALSADGGSQLLGIAMGTNSSDGMLIRGHINISVQGVADEGIPLYVNNVGGQISTVAPVTSGHFVRLVGWCVNNAGVIYFSPSNDWIELA